MEFLDVARSLVASLFSDAEVATAEVGEVDWAWARHGICIWIHRHTYI